MNMDDKKKDKKSRKIVNLRVRRLKEDATNGVAPKAGKSLVARVGVAWSRWGKKALMAATVVAATCFLFPSVAYFQADEFQVGAIAKRDVVAPVAFQVFKDRGRLEQERDREAAKVQGEIFTEIVPASKFYLAEAYHQKYRLRQVPDLMKEFSVMYPANEGFVASTAAARVNGYLGGYGTVEALQAELSSLGLSAGGSKRLLDIVYASGH